MLFPYKYVPHSMEKMQGYIDYIFFELWCKAPSREYDESLFDKNIELKELIADFYYTETKGGRFFISKLLEIYELFTGLSKKEIAQLKKWYKANNNIEKLCSRARQTRPVRYAEFNEFNNNLSSKFAEFFKRLFDQEMLGLKSVTSKIGSINDHHKKFTTANSKEKCPFCGLNSIKGPHHSRREAYDHYLPKSIYPFNSINFCNLAPMCHECNSSYKLSKDPIHDSRGKRRKAFYSYSLHQPEIRVNVQIRKPDINELNLEDLEVTIDCDGHDQEVDTWMELFGIEERYKGKCLSESDGKYWIIQLYEARNRGQSIQEILESIKSIAKKYPYSDTNFLRKPYLEACESVGLFCDG